MFSSRCVFAFQCSAFRMTVDAWVGLDVAEIKFVAIAASVKLFAFASLAFVGVAVAVVVE